MEQELKKMVSFRMKPELIELIENVQAIPETMFFDRDKTWLIEYAIEMTYRPFIESYMAETA